MLYSLKKDLPFELPAPVILTGAGLLVVFLLAFWPSHTDLIKLWDVNETYSHGFIIPFIAAYLVYQQNTRLRHSLIEPSPLLLIPLIATLLLWFVAIITDTKVIELSLLPFIFILAYSSMIGIQSSRLILAALIYLIFAVPFWNFLVPPLQYIATYVNEFALRMIGLPIFIEDTMVSTPVGTFEIEGGCSGIRYLIVTIALGYFYSLINYKKLKTITILLGLSVIFPMVTNWIRIYIIILAGHYSEMESSLVDDHVGFGWVLYGISLVPLFFIAQNMAKKEATEIDVNQQDNNLSDSESRPFNRTYYLLPVVLLISTALFSNFLKQSVPESHKTIANPDAEHPWLGPIYSSGWKPNYNNASIEKNLLFLGKDNTPDISLHIFYYGQQSQDTELINELNTIADYHIIKHSQTEYFKNHKINENILEISASENRLVWYWFNVHNKNIEKPITAKLYQALERIEGKTSSSLIAISASCQQPKCLEEKKHIKNFLNKHHDKITKSLRM